MFLRYHDNCQLVQGIDLFIAISLLIWLLQILENELGEYDSVLIDRDSDPGSVLMQLARDTEQLAMFDSSSARISATDDGWSRSLEVPAAPGCPSAPLAMPAAPGWTREEPPSAAPG
jgi:hypothetical protein